MRELTSISSNVTFLTTEQAAKFLKVSVKTLKSWRRIQSQGPPYSNQGHFVRYRLSDLEAYMRKNRVVTPRVKALLDTIKYPKTIHLDSTNSVEPND